MENNRFADGGNVCIESVDQIQIKATARQLSSHFGVPS